jgi:hypothetical protein
MPNWTMLRLASLNMVTYYRGLTTREHGPKVRRGYPGVHHKFCSGPCFKNGSVRMSILPHGTPMVRLARESNFEVLIT